MKKSNEKKQYAAAFSLSFNSPFAHIVRSLCLEKRSNDGGGDDGDGGDEEEGDQLEDVQVGLGSCNFRHIFGWCLTNI